jgi:uncharacterized protein with ATP-grasp and redox domains
VKAYLDCYPCFFSQTLKTARMITQDERRIHRILTEVSVCLPKVSFEATPPEIGKEVYKIISEMTGIEDPYKEIKRNCIQQALSLYPELKRRIANSEDRLMTAIRLSIAGNVIDFGANADFNLRKDVRTILTQKFAINHEQEFRRRLSEARKILYIADNAGETVFDRLLIEELQKPVIYVVRERPIINDATREDARLSGIDKVAKIISSGCDAPGTIRRFCSEEFLNLYHSADFIISKGQGNYEGLSEDDRPIFFLLKAKCEVIARDIGVETGSIVLMEAKH